jgi:gas vesicle protein
MDAEIQKPRESRFAIGLVTGAVVGVGLAMWLGPGVTRSARRVRQALGDLASQGQDVRDDVADAVAHGAHQVERYATAAKSHRKGQRTTRKAADRRPAAGHSAGAPSAL